MNLDGVGERHGEPLTLADLRKEVEKRFDLATAAGCDPQITLAETISDEEVAAITGKLDSTTLDWLLEHKDPERQRTAAKAILDARANLPQKVPLNNYAVVVAEAVARSRGLKSRRHRRMIAVEARTILLRSADPRWQRQRQGALRPLSSGPYSPR